MDVVIDARMVNENLNGIARYTYEIVKGLSKDYTVNIKLLVNDVEISKNIFCNVKNIEYVKMKSKFLSLLEQIELALVINKFGKNVIFHSPSFVSSPFIRCKSIMTIHDLNHIKFPQFYSKFHKYYYEYIVKSCAKRSEKILTDSSFSKSEILEWLGCKADKVIITYCGVDEKFKKIEDKEKLLKVKQKYKLPDNYVLYLGNLKPHKNVETLVKAIVEVNEEVKLVINGKMNESLNKIIDDYKLNDKVIFIGYVKEEDLPALYSLAKVFAFPSLYEGFGLPPLEAMSCGCPVIVSNKSSLPEVVGKAAIMVDPYDMKDLAKSINSIINNDALGLEMKKKGILQSKNFSWNNTVSKTYSAYKSLYRKN